MLLSRHTRRREVIALLAGAVALTRAGGSRASARRPVLIGWIGTISNARAAEYKRIFAAGMRELGYEAGRDYLVEDRHADERGEAGFRRSRPISSAAIRR